MEKDDYKKLNDDLCFQSILQNSCKLDELQNLFDNDAGRQLIFYLKNVIFFFHKKNNKN